MSSNAENLRANYAVGDTYPVIGGWHKGRTFRLDGFFQEVGSTIAYGQIIETNTRLNMPLQHLAHITTAKVASIRQMAQKLLKAGKRDQALKILQQLPR